MFFKYSQYFNGMFDITEKTQVSHIGSFIFRLNSANELASLYLLEKFAQNKGVNYDAASNLQFSGFYFYYILSVNSMTDLSKNR